MSQQSMVHANGVALCCETFGDRTNPTILLIGGAACSMDWWEDEFCERLAGGRRFVIRYDHRDTGRSVSYEPGAPGYTVRDLGEDALGLLDVLGVDAAHLVGVSMGGGIAQCLALDHPARCASLTLISTSPGGPGGPGAADLPPMSPKLARVFDEPALLPDWTDSAAVVEYIVDGLHPFEGSIPLDETTARALVGRVVDRTVNIASTMTNHWMLESGRAPCRPRLGQIRAPTLVMHGTDDPLLPWPHGVALAREIPGARLIPLQGVGHEVPPRPVWDTVVDAILQHTSGPRAP
jgi:pimeloyl-ACP methyl ester carboxylesterase